MPDQLFSWPFADGPRLFRTPIVRQQPNRNRPPQSCGGASLRAIMSGWNSRSQAGLPTALSQSRAHLRFAPFLQLGLQAFRSL
jgi:hypothetical protein